MLLAVCDADSVFTLVDIDFTGSQYANDVLYNTSLGKKIIDNELNLPPERKLADTDLTIPFYLVAGETFPLYCNIMKPYAYNNDECLKYFNIQISNAIVPIDTAFSELIVAVYLITIYNQCSFFRSLDIKMENFTKSNFNEV